MTERTCWITITPVGGRFGKRVRSSSIDSYGLMEDSIGGARVVAYVEMHGHAILVKETIEQLAKLLETETHT